MKKFLVVILSLFLFGCSSNIDLNSINAVQFYVVANNNKDVSSKSITVFKKDNEYFINAVYTKNDEKVEVENLPLSEKEFKKITDKLINKNINFSKNSILSHSNDSVFYMLNVNSKNELFQTAIEDEEIISLFEDIYKTYIGAIDEKDKSVNFAPIVFE